MKNKKKITNILSFERIKKDVVCSNDNTCISCGAIIPEGEMVCIACEKGVQSSLCLICQRPIGNGETICSDCGERIMRSENKD